MGTRQRIFAICGIVAPVLFTMMVAVESLLRPGYSQVSNYVSDLGTGPHAIVQNANFIVFGLLTLGFAMGLHGALPAARGRASKAGVALVVVFGMGVLLAGVFPEDYLSGAEHQSVSSVAFIASVAAQLLIWRGLRGGERTVWGGYRAYSLVSGLLTLVLLLGFGYYAGGPDQGAAQRVFLAVPWVWVTVTGLKLYSLTKRSDAASVPAQPSS
jgi:hypothetical membrane protein